MQDDVKAVGQVDRDAAAPFADGYTKRDGYSDRYWIRQGQYDDYPLVQAFTRHRITALAALQQRCERLEEAARAALPWVTGEEEATALEAALAPEHSGGYSMAPEDTDPKLAGLCGGETN